MILGALVSIYMLRFCGGEVLLLHSLNGLHLQTLIFLLAILLVLGKRQCLYFHGKGEGR